MLNSPTNLEEHLKQDEENIVSFKAMLKHYGVPLDIVSIPESVVKATAEKFVVLTP